MGPGRWRTLGRFNGAADGDRQKEPLLGAVPRELAASMGLPTVIGRRLRPRVRRARSRAASMGLPTVIGRRGSRYSRSDLGGMGGWLRAVAGGAAGASRAGASAVRIGRLRAGNLAELLTASGAGKYAGIAPLARTSVGQNGELFDCQGSGLRHGPRRRQPTGSRRSVPDFCKRSQSGSAWFETTPTGVPALLDVA